MSINDYFEEIGLWPRESRALLPIYILGFTLSLALTLAAYFLTVHTIFVPHVTLGLLGLLACLQFAAQVRYFLHLEGSASRERTMMLSFSVLIVLILVVGSLWIMFNLNERMMNPIEAGEYMSKQQGI